MNTKQSIAEFCSEPIDESRLTTKGAKMKVADDDREELTRRARTAVVHSVTVEGEGGRRVFKYLLPI